MDTPKLGIIAGAGSLPRELVALCRETGRDYFILAIPGETDPETVDGSPHAWIRMGAAGAGIRHLKDNGVKDLVMAGGMHRPSLSGLRPDWRGAKILAKLGMRALGDDGLLSVLIEELESEGFTLVGIDTLLSDNLAPPGSFGRGQPDSQALSDIAHGFRVAHTLGQLDIGQAVVVQQGLVLGVEAIEGTDALIRRCGPLARGGTRPVLIKAKKPDQERRADLPAIGPQTIQAIQAQDFAGVAVEARATLILERAETVRLADQAGMFIYGYMI